MAGTTAVGLSGLTLNTLLRNKTGNAKISRISRSSFALGTGVTLTVYHENAKLAGEAIDSALKGIDEVEEVMSLYRPGSQISQLNQSGHLDNPHPYLIRVLEKSAQLSRQTEGLFDISIQPMWSLYNKCSQEGRLPNEEELENTLAKVDWRKIRVSPNRIELTGKGMELTLNGIAQGFAADVVAMELGRFGIENALIDTGEISGLGSHVEKDAWDIGIKHPRNFGEFMGTTALNNRCLATSGDYESRFGEGFQSHHLLNPRTGKSPLELSSVSVAAPTALDADALSTAVFLSGLEKGRQLVESSPNADALFVMKDGQTVCTAGFPFSSIS